MIIRKYINLNAPLTEEQIARLKKLEEMPDDEINFDDIPEQTPEQLKQFRRVFPLEKVKSPIRDELVKTAIAQ